MNTTSNPQPRPEALDRWRVLKFGGTSVTGSFHLDVIRNVVGERCVTCRPVVVVSALSGVTDLLTRTARLAAEGRAEEPLVQVGRRHVEAIHDLGLTGTESDRRVMALLAQLERLANGIEMVRECSPSTLDQVLSLGERMSSELIAGGLSARGLPAEAVDAAELIVTDARFGRAAVDFEATALRTLAAARGWHGAVPVVTGFLGACPDGKRTTLGRGGSDYSAAVLGWALHADAVEVWTDVDGVMTADPRVVPGARPLRSIGYSELLELSHWGARVVHPKTIGPLRDRDIPLLIRNTLSPEDPGTSVVSEGEAFPNGAVRGIASIDNVALIQLNGYGRESTSVAARFLGALDRAGVTALIVSQASSERSVSAALPADSVDTAIAAIRDEFALERRAGLVDDPIVESDCSVVAAVGSGMRDCPGVAGLVFGALGGCGVNVRAIAQGSSELNISFVVRAGDAAAAVRAIHDTFFSHDEGSPKPYTSASPAYDLKGDLDVVDLTTRLVAIPSVSGSERRVVRYVARLLEVRGWQVTLQPVSVGRDNIWATRGRGEVTFSTHLDTVPDTFGPRVENGSVVGRGSCDAKGIAAAMICAAERLTAAGEERVDLLFLVGEESGSDGARAANGLAATSRYLVNGEPTECVLANASKGTLRCIVRTTGAEAHSAYPERGTSAITAMLALLAEIEALDLPLDPVLGQTTINVGKLSGGTAANVIAGACEAEMMIRLVGDADAVHSRLEEWAAGRATLTWGSHVPPQRFHVIDGLGSTVVGYTSDAPLLPNWGTPLLFGPGSIHDAHTPTEHVMIDDLRAAVDGYERIARSLLGS